jgi:PAS domain S-box-containing protein
MKKSWELVTGKLKRAFRKKALPHGELPAADDKFRVFIELAPDAFFQADRKGNFITVNNKAVELTGYTQEELLKMRASGLFPTEVLKENPLRYDLLKTGAAFKAEREIIRKTRERIQVEMNSIAMPDGTYQSFVRDITERKKTEENVRVSEARLKRAELASKSGNWELHIDTHTMIGSAGASKIYGVEQDHLDFSVVKKVPLPEYRSMLDLALKELIENDKPYDIEFKIRAIDTNQVKDIHSIAVFDRERRILFGIIQDITDRKRVQEELINAKEKAEESDRLKTAFLQNLSHEIRTPMNAIVGFSQLMKETFNDRSRFEKYAEIIHLRSNDLLNIINDILDIAMIESGQLPLNPEACDINALFEELSSFFAEYSGRVGKQHLRFGLQPLTDPSLNNILTDKVKLKQVLINLISNAVKFTEEGIITGGCKPAVNNLVFYITDTGIGIPAANQQVVFERFIQLNQMNTWNAGGNGLGLSIVKGLVNLMGGEVFLDSEPGKGSTFSFTIPLVVPQPVKPEMAAEEEPAMKNFSGKTVLVVEDDQYNAEYLKEILTGLGITYLQASNGSEAVEYSKSHDIDLVLMDIRLPDFGGYEATRRIRQFKPELKIVAQTAYASHDERQKAIHAGCIDYLSKPTRKEALLSVLNKHLVAAPK